MQILVQGNEGLLTGEAQEGAVDAGGEESGFEAGDAEEVVLGEGDAFDGAEFLGTRGG